MRGVISPAPRKNCPAPMRVGRMTSNLRNGRKGTSQRGCVRQLVNGILRQNVPWLVPRLVDGNDRSLP